MASTTKRQFTDEFKREAVALWETSGRSQTEVASELGIVPTMLRRWQRKLREVGAHVRPAAKPPISTMTSPADQEAIARLRRELEWARMERDILKNVWPAPRRQGDFEAGARSGSDRVPAIGPSPSRAAQTKARSWKILR
jgi:transposase